MKKTFYLILFILMMTFSVRSQQTHFIYIQSEGKQPFYVRMKEKIISSSETGYLIIPRLEAGQISFTLGFPKNAWPSSSYNLEIENKDLGYQLKLVDTTTWALYNIQTGDLLSPAVVSKTAVQLFQTSTDEFTNVLAEVSNTPSVKQKKIVADTMANNLATAVTATSIEKTNQTETVVSPVQAADTNQIVSHPVQPSENNVVVVNPEPERKSKKSKSKIVKADIKQDFAFLDSTGRSLTYTIKEGEKEDHVVVFISYEKPLVFPKQETDSVLSTITQTVELPDTNAVKTNAIKCASFAEDKDFLKLRRKMTQEDNEEKMIEVARKSFEDKCYTAEQVKNLAVLFLDEDNRLEFVKMSVKYIRDVYMFGTLQQLFTTEKNVNRFKEIVY